MRKLVMVVMAGVGIALGGAAVARAGEDDGDRRAGAITRDGDDDGRRVADGLEVEIDPELDVQFGPRRVNAAQAAAIVEAAFPGARATAAELDEEDDDPIWEVEFVRGGREDEVDVDATTGTIRR